MKISIPLALTTMLAIGGCASNPSSTVFPPAPAVAEPAAGHTVVDRDMVALGLRKDMTGEEVRGVLGTPVSTAPMPSPEGKAEIWTFRRAVSGGTRQVQTGMREVPYFDPLTGAEGTLQEPVYEVESIEATEEIELLLFNDRLVSWKRKYVGVTNSYR